MRSVPSPDTRFRTLSQAVRLAGMEPFRKVTVKLDSTCPNRDGTLGLGGCSFCCGEELIPHYYRDGMPLDEQISRGAAQLRARGRAVRFVVYLQDHTVTHHPEVDLERLIHTCLDRPDAMGVAIGTRPDCLSDRFLDTFSMRTAGTLSWLDLGLQLASDRVLALANRCHRVRDYEDAVARCAARGIRVCAHVLLGLPGQTPDDVAQTADLLRKTRAWGVKVHNLLVLRGTELGRLWEQGGLRCATREEYVQQTVDLLERIPPSAVVHRIASNASERLLLAPEWARSKAKVIDTVRRELGRRDSWQGSALGAAREAPSIAGLL